MDFLNFPAILVAAVSALVVGFIWYNPKVFGNAWMEAAGLTEAQLKAGNMVKIFILSFVFAFFLAMTMMQMSIHQTGVLGLVGGDASAGPTAADLRHACPHRHRGSGLCHRHHDSWYSEW